MMIKCSDGLQCIYNETLCDGYTRLYSADVTKRKYIMSQDQVYILAFTLSYMWRSTCYLHMENIDIAISFQFEVLRPINLVHKKHMSRLTSSPCQKKTYKGKNNHCALNFRLKFRCGLHKGK
jgi:hypothetical protein